MNNWPGTCPVNNRWNNSSRIIYFTLMHTGMTAHIFKTWCGFYFTSLKTKDGQQFFAFLSSTNHLVFTHHFWSTAKQESVWLHSYTIITQVMQSPLEMQNVFSTLQNIVHHLFLLDLRYIALFTCGAIFCGKKNELQKPIENPKQMQNCANLEMWLGMPHLSTSTTQKKLKLCILVFHATACPSRTPSFIVADRRDLIKQLCKLWQKGRRVWHLWHVSYFACLASVLPVEWLAIT